MSTTQIVSKKLHVSAAQDFIYSVKNDGAYYVFAAKHTPYEDGDSSVPTPTDSVGNNVISIYDDMLFGKRVLSNDIAPMIPRYDWTSGTTYAMYDDADNTLHTKQFYACVNAGAQYHVYKCLYNGGNVASTVEPSGTDNDAFESVVDGYIWKYMYSADSATESKFATSAYLPVVANTSVAGNAVPGSIEVIKVNDGGVGYQNYLANSFQKSSDIKVGGNQYKYALGPAASATPGMYDNCLLLITSGSAQDEYRVITNYVIEGADKIAIIDSPFDNDISVNDTFEVYPFVEIFDDGGSKNTNCIARAIISGSSNTISKVEVIDPGSGYRAATAIINSSNAVGITASASLRPIISPPDGHGAHVEDELGANFAGVAVKYIENEGVSPELLTYNDYRQVGILKNPLFANVRITFSAGNTVGNFLANENMLQYKAKQLAGTVNTYSNTTITGNDTLFEEWLEAGDRILITSGTDNVFGNVASITSNTELVLDVNAAFTTDQCNISYVNAVSYGVISANSVGEVYVANVNVATVSTSSKFVGQDSFCTTIADSIQISRSGSTPDLRSTNNFYTFSQLTKFAGSITTGGSFIEDEYIVQSELSYSQPSARLYTAVEAGEVDYLYVTNVKNVWQTSADGVGDVTGNSSSQEFTISNKYGGELIPGSGEVLYTENISPISRSNTQTETIKLILEF